MIESKRATRIVLGIFAVITSIWLVAPMFAVVPISFAENASFQFPPQGFSTRWYESFFTDPSWLRALGNSALIGLLTVLISVPLGTISALAINRSDSRLASVAQMLMLTPMIVPAIIAGAGIYTFFLETDLVGTMFGFVLVHVCLALPLVMIAVTASLAGYDRSLELAAASLGANPRKTFLTVTVPLIAPGVAAGGVFAFVISFDEVIVSQFMVSPALQTLPIAMYSSVTRTTDPTIAAAATLILVSVLVGFGFYRLVAVPLSQRRGGKPVKP
jgi:putative spermidine/putrescine transport system permease protein